MSYSTEQLKAIGQAAAAEFNVPWPIFDAMITVESGWSTSPAEVSSTGAQGIAQIEPGTAQDWGVNPWDPVAALRAAAMHLSEYYTQFGNSWSNALAAYNGGASTQGISAGYAAGYPQKVLSFAQQLGADVSTLIPPVGGSVAGPSPIDAGGGGSSSSSAPAPVTISSATIYAIALTFLALAIVGIATVGYGE